MSASRGGIDDGWDGIHASRRRGQVALVTERALHPSRHRGLPGHFTEELLDEWVELGADIQNQSQVEDDDVLASDPADLAVMHASHPPGLDREPVRFAAPLRDHRLLIVDDVVELQVQARREHSERLPDR
jgi:hypothetical protein